MNTTSQPDEPEAIARQRVAVVGMTCSHCERAVAAEVSVIAGVASVVADAAAGTVTIEAIRQLGIAEIAAAVDEAGFELVR